MGGTKTFAEQFEDQHMLLVKKWKDLEVLEGRTEYQDTSSNALHTLLKMDEPQVITEGIKESEDKLFYEIDWEFISEIAQRMSKNKHKYPPYNWHKPIELEELRQALIRHFIAIMRKNYKDDGQEFGHLNAIALNAMMIWYQLKHHNK
jgi:hypothetical protein